ncbi:DUF2141 domain-containing protein [Novosphingobium sp.]|uniref:DUF2141 domain-containing protein n=1 Tax=Novosphingobium sp. TaxID=1874826 RepID=UPI0035B0032E
MNLPRRLRAAARAYTAPMIAIGAAAGAALALAAAAPATAQSGPPAGCTGTPSATWLNVVVEGVRNSNGLMAVTLYADDSSKFLVKHGSLYVGRVNARAGTTRACIFVPKPGVYALALYHDENANLAFDRTGVGFPAEGFGFSNNPATLAGLPSFKSVRLNVPKAGLTTRITMKYP